MLAPSGVNHQDPYGVIHMAPLGVTHMGPFVETHVGLPGLSSCGAHIGYTSWDGPLGSHMVPMWGSPYGHAQLKHTWDPQTHVTWVHPMFHDTPWNPMTPHDSNDTL